MFRVRPTAFTDHDQVLGLLCRLQAVPSHHIGFHSETRAELADELAALHFPAATFVAVDDAGHVRGVLTVDVDRATGRAYWYGPFVDVPPDHPAADRIWSRTADSLYAAAHTLPLLRGITEDELYGHVAHCRLAAFAHRHGFPPGEYSSLLLLTGVDLVRMIGAVPDRPVDIAELALPPMDSVRTAALVRLHEASFPHASAGALLTDTDHTLVVATDGPRLLGYAAGRAQQDYLIDFVAVAPESRNEGVGAALVTTLVQRLADRHGALDSACAVVAGGNAPARRLLRTLGFQPHLELVSYRRRASSLVA
ncbi:MAG TPA: GNAT family N-acetyltransferase [Pseudonocardiaceae bacterium]|jgi:ribosomal protein S18 acetylase RimI-like enzyme|nr:GNAT family N-acetyltransferase [Pseudonocardiaceae bacterium]